MQLDTCSILWSISDISVRKVSDSRHLSRVPLHADADSFSERGAFHFVSPPTELHEIRYENYIDVDNCHCIGRGQSAVYRTSLGGRIVAFKKIADQHKAREEVLGVFHSTNSLLATRLRLGF